MNVLVAVKEVKTVGDEFDVEGLDIDAGDVQYGMNEWDEYAVEEAVRVKAACEDDDDDVEVVTVTIGPERAEETIRKALAKGADRAIRVWDDALAEQALLDVATRARLLAAVVEEEAPDVVLTGVQAVDDAFGATGVSLAEHVGFGWAAVVTEVEFDGDVVAVRRELEGGVEERSRVALPAVLTIQTGINQPRYASLRGIRQAQSKEIATQSLDDLGLAPGEVESAVTVEEMYEPESGGETRLFEGTPDEQAAALADVLRERGLGTE